MFLEIGRMETTFHEVVLLELTLIVPFGYRVFMHSLQERMIVGKQL